MHRLKKFLKLPLSVKMMILNKIMIKKVVFFILYKHRFMSCGNKTLLSSPLFVTPEFITLGSNINIWPHARIEGIYYYNNEEYNPTLIIEDNVSIQQRVHITFAEELVIGSGTTILFDVCITNIDHEYSDINTPVIDQGLIIKKTSIGKNCFIGAGAKILAGSILGDNCVVGSNSVVKGVFPSGSIIVGVPGKIKKRR